jgi:hypothetical protein
VRAKSQEKCHGRNARFSAFSKRIDEGEDFAGAT